jgi:peptidoglycan/LPS O-acetylase OafA/YrhL
MRRHSHDLATIVLLEDDRDPSAAARQARPDTARASHPTGRDRYLDLLRAIALTRIVTLHTFYTASWLTVVFPSIGVMFALAGSLMARSLERPAAGVLRRRSRRLLLPLWVYSATVLTGLLLQGWRAGSDGAVEWSLKLLLWFVPIGDPPFPNTIGSDAGLLEATWGLQSADILWYIRAYFWFVLLSPLLLRAFRQMPWTTMLTPLALLVALYVTPVSLPAQLDSVAWDFCAYAPCWILGFAHHDGLLRRIPRDLVFVGGIALMSLGLLWVSTGRDGTGWDLGLMPMATALWSLGFCAMLLRISPSWSSFPRALRRLDKPVTLMNQRAITIYLWHCLVLMALVPLIDRMGQYEIVTQYVPWLYSPWMQYVLVWPFLALVVLAVGWVEDVAARRPPRLWPTRG